MKIFLHLLKQQNLIKQSIYLLTQIEFTFFAHENIILYIRTCNHY
jgi:hypothetical protein